ncbi:MAG: antitoxin component YwqK of YwqJK toxin-antitoxin module [Bacteroidia bacterium]|jgi:antitoxin component YwqK of YwqJK toxin-antitoxin module
MKIGTVFLIIIVFSSCDKWTHVTANEKFVDVKNGVVYFEEERFTGHVIAFSNTITIEQQESDTLKLYEVKNGERHGSYQSWYKKGSTNELRRFNRNKRDGFHQKWYPNGQKAFEYHFDEGVYVDTLKEWYSNGQLYLLSHYVNGQQAGRQKAWKETGELYLNYDVVNGRKYGNAGIKHCKSLWSDVVNGM